MSYKTGDLEFLDEATARAEAGYSADEEVDDDMLRPYDNRSDGTAPLPIVRLPHSCDQWVIGGVEEVDAMIRDLQEIRKRFV